MEQRNKSWKSISLFFGTLGGATREVFRHVSYVILALVCAALLFVVMVYLPNFRLIADFVFNPNNPLGTKIGLLIGLLGGIQTNSTAFSATITIVMSGLFGIGCSACGSFLGTAILASLGASGIVALLPLRGGEFGILGITLLLFSIVSISRAIQKHGVCPIEPISEIKK